MNFINKSTSPSLSEVKIEAKSPDFSIAGPDTVLILTPSSLAIISANVVLPRPGGPYNKTWSNDSSLLRAALI